MVRRAFGFTAAIAALALALLTLAPSSQLSHSVLRDLSYSRSGHTGFQAALPDVVTAGDYTNVDVTVSAQGIVTAIANGSAGGEAFPVGAVYVTVDCVTAPATALGYGTWSAVGAGKVLVGLDSGDAAFDTAEETGGAKTVATNVAVADHSDHTHLVSGNTGAGNGAQARGTTADTLTRAVHVHSVSLESQGVTSGPITHSVTNNATSVVQPYLVVCMYKRTA